MSTANSNVNCLWDNKIRGDHNKQQPVLISVSTATVSAIEKERIQRQVS